MHVPSEQLLLPLGGVGPESPSQNKIPRGDRVFVNRDLRLSAVTWVGFDMDYTLAIYRQERMDALSVELTVERLIRRGYPAAPEGLSATTRASRSAGLLVDRRYGHVLKMDRYKVVHRGYHGMRRLEPEARRRALSRQAHPPAHARATTGSTRCSPCPRSRRTPRSSTLLERRGEKVDYDRLFRDVRASIDEAHADGTVYRVVTSAFPEFIETRRGARAHAPQAALCRASGCFC